MRKTRIRLQLAVLLFILLPATAGVIAVHASATCERFVRTYVTRPVRNRVSKTTADAWAAWRVAHPNWKPKADVHRPKYVMTRDEQVNKIDFACEVPTEPTNLAVFFKPMQVDPPPVILPTGMSTQTAFPIVPTEVAQVVTPLPTVAAFVSPPPIPVPGVNISIPGPVPEPMSLILVASGMGFLWLLAVRRRARLNVAQARPSGFQM